MAAWPVLRKLTARQPFHHGGLACSSQANGPEEIHLFKHPIFYHTSEAQAEQRIWVPTETSLRRDGPCGALIAGPLQGAPRGALRRLRFASRRLHPWQVSGAVTHSPCRVRTLQTAAPLATAAGGCPTPDGGVRSEPQSLPRGALVCGGSSQVGAVNTAPDSGQGRRKRAASRQGLKGGAAHRGAADHCVRDGYTFGKRFCRLASEGALEGACPDQQDDGVGVRAQIIR